MNQFDESDFLMTHFFHLNHLNELSEQTGWIDIDKYTNIEWIREIISNSCTIKINQTF